VGLVSHFPSADEPERVFTEQQIRVFGNLVETGRSMGLALAATSLANSAGIMAFEGSHFHLARPGIMLYGGLPSPGFRSPVGLKPVMHFKGTILQIREFPAGTPISYGRTYRTRDRENIAVLSAGYGDGIPRSLSNHSRVLIRGRKVPIVGRVCMNMTMVNISDLEPVAVGEEAIFLGTQGDAVITGDDMASWADTISYEIYCSIGQRHKREYIG
jgi:alanine racemase